jgi:hypothetical protein
VHEGDGDVDGETVDDTEGVAVIDTDGDEETDGQMGISFG